MKKLIILLALLIAGAGYNDLSARHQGKHKSIRSEQRHQKKRIKQGVASGELTHREARHLKAQQAHITHHMRKAASDGVVTRQERIHIKSEQERAGRNIYRQKHDHQYR